MVIQHAVTTTIEKISFPLVFIASSLALFFTSQYNFLIFHLLVEIFTTVIGFGIFVIAWSSRRYIDNNFLLIIGIGYFFIGCIDLIHALTYGGMSILSGYTSNLPTQLWIIARYLESLTFLGALLFLRKRSAPGVRVITGKSEIIFLIYAVIFALLLLSVFDWKIFPAAYIDGIGLTTFKRISEYIISSFFLISIVLIFKKRKLLDSKIVNLVSLALLLKIASELSFTEYVGVYDFSNVLGHLFKFMSFAILYKSILQIGLMKPYEFLFLDLRKSQEEYRMSQEELQKRIEEHLEEAYKHLGVANRKISLLLEMEEHSHKKKNKKEIIEYIVNLVRSASHAEEALLYRYDGNKEFSLILENRLDNEKKRKNLQNLTFEQARFLEKLMTERRRINSSCQNLNPGILKLNGRVNYFVALPLLVEKICWGFLFLGFKKRTSMETQETEFLDIFAVHASSALSRLKVIGSSSKK